MKRFARSFLLFALVALPLRANTYKVDNTNDWFWGSLREAIQNANSHPGPDTIVFAIGSGPKTIRLDNPLPAITDTVTIDGTTQPGFAGKPLIELDGSKMAYPADGLTINAQSTIRGLVINRFGGNGIRIENGNGTVIQGCWIGLGLDGSTGFANGGHGLTLFGDDCLIGGDGPNQGNVISYNTGSGIVLIQTITSSDHGNRNRIQGNFIGLDATGTFSRGNGRSGIAIANGADNIIGGDTAAQGNLISGNGTEGVRIDAHLVNGQELVRGTILKLNKIGVNKNGTAVGNGYWGGGTGAGVASFAPGTRITQNVIANNNTSGVIVRRKSGTAVTNNSIVANGGLGIDLGANDTDTGVTLNDLGDGDTGGNGLLNFPILTQAYQDGGTRVVGTYQGAPNQSFSLDFYESRSCDNSGYGEGESYLGSTSVTTDAAGNASFSALFRMTTYGTAITATALDSGQSTSEFSPCRAVTYAPPVITGLSSQGGRVGTTLTITGLNFLAINSVKFFNGSSNTVNAPFTLIGNTISTSVPLGAKIGPIAVIGTYGTAMSASFRVTPPTGDFNGDGRPDLVWRNYRTGQDFIAITGGAAVPLVDVYDVTWQIQGTGDFNNDGSHDIVWRNYTTGENGIWMMNGTTLVGWASLPAVADRNEHIAAVGDFNGDGSPDLVWRNDSTGDGSIWFMAGTSFSGTGATLPNVSPLLRIEATGDFNGDGKTDLLWRNSSTGENSIWFMNGGSWPGTGTTLPTVADLGWTIEAAVDWDQDGDLDIVWRNISTGENRVWLLIGPFWNGVSYIDLAPDTDTDLRIEDL